METMETMEKIITNRTVPIKIEVDDLIEFNTKDVERFNTIAENISRETGALKELIYTAPSFFFIDQWHKINGEWYFYKERCDFQFLNEILGEIISEYFQLDTVHYNVAKLCVKGKEETLGLISKNFCNPNYSYKRVWDLNIKSSNNLSNFKDFRNIVNSDEEYFCLIDDLKKFIIRDFYTTQRDRSGNNFLFKISDEGTRLAPLYDYENSFYTSELCVYINQIFAITLNNYEIQQLFRNDIKFQELLYMIMQANMSTFIKEAEERHQIRVPNKYKDFYKTHDKEIKCLVKQYMLLK